MSNVLTSCGLSVTLYTVPGGVAFNVWDGTSVVTEGESPDVERATQDVGESVRDHLRDKLKNLKPA